jgi:hypothetical protein
MAPDWCQGQSCQNLHSVPGRQTQEPTLNLQNCPSSCSASQTNQYLNGQIRQGQDFPLNLSWKGQDPRQGLGQGLLQ